jgi:epoxyqueuosine reductase
MATTVANPAAGRKGEDGVRAAIRARAAGLGFDAVGFARAELPAAARAGLAGFLAAGAHGDMAWLAAKADRRGDPQVLWPEVRSVVVLGMNYGPGAAVNPPDRGTISVYARNRDYHELIKGRLKQLGGWMAARFGGALKVFVDTAPVMEKPLAVAAGLGWAGKHTNLVSRGFGSWLLLGEIFTTLDLPPDPPVGDHCGACRRCLDACPTGALTGSHRLDARRCLSYLTIEHAGPIPAELRPLFGNRIYGCDDCLAVCPWNKFARAAREAGLCPRPDLTAPRLAELARMEEAGFRAHFAGSPVKRIGRDRFLRNVLIAIGNSADPALIPAAAARLADPAPLVREMADWAVARLDPTRLA